jgi:hypothetical protein
MSRTRIVSRPFAKLWLNKAVFWQAFFLFETVLYHEGMTTILDRAVSKAKTLSKQRQNEIGEMMLAVVEQDTSEHCLSKVQAADWQLPSNS